jgi:hypothetical protein
VGQPRAIEHLDHPPTEAELHAIKERYLAMGFDVVSVRVIERAFPKIGPGAGLTTRSL